MFHRLGYRPEPSSTYHAFAHIQWSLLAWGTHTPNNRLKLSSEPCISARSQVFQVSPHTPTAFPQSQQPTGQVQVAPFVFRTPPSADLHRFTLDRVCLHYCSSRVRVAQHAFSICLSGSKQNCRSVAPVVAAPAILRRHAASAIYSDLAGSLRVLADVVVLAVGGLPFRPARAGPRGRPPVPRLGRALAPPRLVPYSV